jgi:hypothetical protein
MWQTWFMSAIGLAPILLRMASEAVAKGRAALETRAKEDS